MKISPMPIVNCLTGASGGKIEKEKILRIGNFSAPDPSALSGNA
jgi:hypothetical protein